MENNSNKLFNTSDEASPNPTAKEWEETMQNIESLQSTRPAYDRGKDADGRGTVLSEKPFENEMDAKQELETGRKHGRYPTTARAVMLPDDYYYVIEPNDPNKRAK